MSPRLDRTRQEPDLRVGFILAPDFTLSALSLFVDVLRLSADEGDGSRPIRCVWSVMSDRSDPLRSSCGIELARTSPLIDPPLLDYVVVVGGLLHTRKTVSSEVVAYLRTVSEAGVPLVGLCTGSFVLARAGLMQGYRCCVSWYHVRDFAEEFPGHSPVADRLFLVDGPRITCSGGAGVADLAALIVERHLGRSVAQKALHILLLQHARSGSDAQPHMPVAEAIRDDRVRRAVLLMEQNIANPLPIEDLAMRLGLSPRQLERLFVAETARTPGAVYRELRLHHARWLIENTGMSLTDIANATGFCDSAHFSRQFKSFFSILPRDLKGSRHRTSSEADAVSVAHASSADRGKRAEQTARCRF